MIKAEVYVPTLPRNFFILEIVNGGLGLEVRIEMPSFFVKEERVIQSNNHVRGFNQNTHEAQAFKDVSQEIDKHFGMTNHIFGDNPFVIDLPFTCEERIVSWELQAYHNDLGDLTDELGGQQFHMVLVVYL